MRTVVLRVVGLMAAWLLWICIPSAHSEGISVAFSDPATQGLVQVHLAKGTIRVQTSSEGEVRVEATSNPSGISMKSELHERGMQRIDISKTGLTIEETDNVMLVRAQSQIRAVDLKLQVPPRTSLRLSTLGKGGIYVDGVEGSIDASSVNGEVELRNISGPTNVHAINAGVSVTFVGAMPPQDMFFGSVNGTIDVTLGADLGCSLRIETHAGQVYTDFDIQMEPTPILTQAVGSGKTVSQPAVQRAIRGTLNGGGKQILFRSLGGAIYIRKAPR